MLKTRVITALVLLPIVLIALFLFTDWAWGLFTFVIAGLACWEWSRFCKLSVTASRAYLTVSLALSALLFLAYQKGQLGGVDFASLALTAFVCAALFWLVAVPVWLLKCWVPKNGWAIALAGWLVVFPFSLALLALHDISPWLLLTFGAIVWVADIAAYFVGKRFGKNKLAAAISPGKTIEGALGGIAGVVAYYFLWQYLVANSYVSQHAWAQDLRSNQAMLLAFFGLLAALSVIGDLFESWMKRGAGMKDSSKLLPGHGGVLDRIDALTSTLPLAGLYVLLTRP